MSRAAAVGHTALQAKRACPPQLLRPAAPTGLPIRWLGRRGYQRLDTASLCWLLQISCGSSLVDVQAFETLAQVAAVLTALHGAAEAAIADGAASGLPDSLAAQLGTAASAVQEPMQALLRYVTANVDGGLDQLMVQLRPLLQPAADLAALMQQYYALPEIDQPHRLAVAQAAAGRCCAYLRCANAGGEGGPAAGKGVGSKRCRWVLRGRAVGGCHTSVRHAVGSCACALLPSTPHQPHHPLWCSACRAVWYCGTACSHADWREGGHRRVCRALGAARAAEKEARRAAEAAAAGQE